MLSRAAVAAVSVSAAVLTVPARANAAFPGPDTMVGMATVSHPSADRVVIYQQSARAVIRWRDFAVGAQTRIEIEQPDAACVLVILAETRTQPARMMGALRSNGQIALLDPAGVEFGAGSRVDVGGLVVSTGHVDVAAFMAGRTELDLTNMTSAAVVNPGDVTAAEGGLVAFLASRVVNSGTVEARLGRVELGAGRAATLDLRRESAAPMVLWNDGSPAWVENRGTISAAGGRVALTTESIDDKRAVGGAIEMTGVIRVQTVGARVGRATLKGGHARVSFHGQVHANGEDDGEDGGWVEVSAADHIVFDGAVDTSARHGRLGHLLIDPAAVSIGNGPSTPDGTYMNAQNLADTIFNTNVTIAATSHLDVVDSIDLSVSPTFNAGTLGSLTLTAPTLNISGNVAMGSGNVALDCNVLNLAGTFTAGGSVMCGTASSSACTRLTGTATQVNVLGSGANLSQAISAAASAARVQVSPGTYPGNYNLLQPITLVGNPGDPLVDGADPGAPLLVGTQSGGTVLSLIGVSNVTIEGFRMSGGVDGVPVHNSVRAISSTSSNGLVVTNNSFDGFSGDGIVLFFGSNDSVTYNTFANVGTSTINSSNLTNPDIHDNIVAVPAAAPALDGKAVLALAGILLAAGLCASRTRPAVAGTPERA